MSEIHKEKVLKAGAGYVIGNYLLKGLSFLAIPIFARIMDKSDYGIYNAFIAYEGILFVLIGWAIHTSYKNANLKFHAPDAPYQYKSYISDTLVLVIATGLAYLLLANIIYTFVPGFLGMTRLEINLLVLYAFASAIIICYNTDVGVRYEAHNFLKVAAINAVMNIGLSVFLILVFFRDRRYEGRILGTVIPAFLIAVVICFRYLKRNRPQMNREQLAWGMKYSLPIIPHGISQRILGQFDRIMIINMISSEASGIYSFAANITLILSVAYQSVDTVWTQWFYDKRKNDQFESIRKYSAIYMIIVLMITIVLMLAAPEMIAILGPAYKESVWCVFPLLAGTYFTFLYNIPSIVEYYHEKTKNIAIATASAAVLNMVLNYIFIKSYGYVAAAYTTMATYFFYFMFHLIMARKIDPNPLFSIRTIGACIAGLLAATFLSLVMINLPVIRWILAVSIGVGTAIYAEKKVGITKVLLKKFRRA